ncbi:purine catabolism regulatory protein [Mycobacterium sp. 88mf]|jgi:purine catabolism regulator|nr:purine catabolism regulatory protein [Mycobacterium sp. 88mf]SFF12450.1 purine catabolism regulatory protein [Mycobacterium sp. 455mf]
MSLTVRDVLAHPSLQSARPAVLSGHDSLEHPVRWVHSTDLYDIAGLLRGDEVLLTNGVGLLDVGDAGRRLYIRRLAERGVAGLFFEVGRTFEQVPPEMVEEALPLGFPVVELAPTLRFTEVAEAVNSELIDRSVSRLRYADETSRALSEALARGATLNELIDQVAAMLGTSARLSDYAGSVTVESMIGDSIGGPRSEVPVMVDGTAWGRLSVDPEGVPELLCAAVLDRAPTVLGLCLMREQAGIAGTLRAQQLVLDQLVANRASEHSMLESRLRAAGVATADQRYVCVAIDPQRVESVASVADALMRQVGHGIFGLVDGLLCGVLAMPAGVPSTDVLHAVREFARVARIPRNHLCATVSRTVDEIGMLPRAMVEARETLRLGQGLGEAGPVIGAQALVLERLLAHHGDADAMRQFVDDQIGALERSDEAKGSELVRTLQVLIACAGSKAEAAKRLHIRRQSLYYRLDQVARLLETDLDEPGQLTTLAVAIAARRLQNMSR